MDAIICKNVVQVPFSFFFFFLLFPFSLLLRRLTPTLFLGAAVSEDVFTAPVGATGRPFRLEERHQLQGRFLLMSMRGQRETLATRWRERQQGEKVEKPIKNELVLLVDVMRKDLLRFQTIIQR